MKLDVDLTLWHKPCNQARPRLQSIPRQEAINKQIQEYLRLGVIVPAPEAEYFSQIHMVAKPGTNNWQLNFVKLKETTITNNR